MIPADFYFVAPLRHPDNSANYAEVLKCLELSIESVKSQDTEFSVRFLIICNERPKLDIVLDDIEFLEVNFCSSGSAKGRNQRLIDVEQDKGAKIAAGLIKLTDCPPSHVAIMDADDWVHKTLVQHVMSNDTVDMWYVNKGLLVNRRNLTFVRKYGLCRYCGSTYVFKFDKLLKTIAFSATLLSESPRDAFTEEVDSFTLQKLLGSHRHQLGYFHRKGFRIRPLPMNAVCWVVNSGENHSSTWIAPRGLPISKDLLADYGLRSLKPLTTKTSVIQRLRELFERTKSFAGWFFTNRHSTKV